MTLIVYFYGIFLNLSFLICKMKTLISALNGQEELIQMYIEYTAPNRAGTL